MMFSILAKTGDIVIRIARPNGFQCEFKELLNAHRFIHDYASRVLYY
jgi:hypothetical protein